MNRFNTAYVIIDIPDYIGLEARIQGIWEYAVF